jgi:hypothetical protein
MHIFFSTNENYYSKFARFLFGETTSHVGIGFTVLGCPLVIDCTKPYGKIYHLSHWRKKYDIKYLSIVYMDPQDDELAFRLASSYAVMKPYDWNAYFYGLYCGLKLRFLGSKLPDINKYDDPETDLCTEIFNPLKTLLLKYGINLTNIDLSARTPDMLANDIYKQTKNNEKVVWYDFPA